jgi:hypothetical protein
MVSSSPLSLHARGVVLSPTTLSKIHPRGCSPSPVSGHCHERAGSGTQSPVCGLLLSLRSLEEGAPPDMPLGRAKGTSAAQGHRHNYSPQKDLIKTTPPPQKKDSGFTCLLTGHVVKNCKLQRSNQICPLLALLRDTTFKALIAQWCSSICCAPTAMSSLKPWHCSGVAHCPVKGDYR